MTNERCEKIFAIVKSQTKMNKAVWVKERKSYRGYINNSVVEMMKSSANSIWVRIEHEGYDSSASRDISSEHAPELFAELSDLFAMVKEKTIDKVDAIIADMAKGAIVFDKKKEKK